MKKIKIFLSIDDSLKSDKLEISNFIRYLNETYEESNLYFQIIETKDKIKESDIKESELFFIIFQNELHEKNEEEFKVAYQLFQKGKTPRITTYIKKSKKKESASVLNFLNYLDEKLGHYYNKYENIDSVKLNFILQLKALGLELGKLEAKDDKIYLNEKETLKATNIPMIANNKNLEMLKEERRNLEDKYYLYREKIKKEIDNDDILDEYIKIKNRKKEVEEEIYSLEQDILSLEETFIEITSKGKLSKRQIYAKKCLDEGDIEEAKEILSFNVLKEDGDKLLTLLEKRKEEIQVIVNEFIQRINTLKLDIKNKNRFEEIEESYEEAIRIEKEGGLKRDTLYDYALYLYQQNNYLKSKEYADKYLNYLLANDSDSYSKAVVYNLLGILCHDTNLYKKSKEYYLKSNNLYEKLYQDNPKEYASDLADSYNNLGVLYSDICKYQESLEYTLKAIEIMKKLYQDNPKVYANDLARYYNNLGVLYSDIGEFQKSLEYSLKAIELLENLYQKNSDSYMSDLADSYNNLGNLYFLIKEYSNCEKYYLKALDLREKLYHENPDAHQQDLAFVYDNLGSLYLYTYKFQESESNYLKALDLREKLYHENPDAYQQDLAFGYDNLANLYRNIKRYEESLEYSLKAITLLEKLYEINPDVYQMDLAISYDNLRRLYHKIKKYEETEKYSLKAIELYEKLYSENIKTHEDDLINLYNDLGDLYFDFNEYQKSCECYLKLIEITKNTIDKDYMKEGYKKLLKLYETENDKEKIEETIKKLKELDN